MNITEIIKQFIESDVFESLTEEASDNIEACKLLEIITLSVESLIFFKEHDVQNRVQLESQNLNTLFNYLKEVYQND
jgi:hypothetical protein